MTGRNDPCPCGSGNKYKRCCLRAAEEPSVFTPQDRHSAQEKLFDFGGLPRFDAHRRVCTIRFWGSPERAERARQMTSDDVLREEAFRYVMWLDLDVDQDEGRTVLDQFLVERGHDLQPGERGYLERVRQSHLALYEVEEVSPGEGMRLRDVWLDRSYWIVERSASTQLVSWDLLATRVFEAADGELQIEGDSLPLHRWDREQIVERIEAEYEVYRAHTRGTKAAFLKRNGYLFHALWMDLMLFRPPPKMVTPEGTPLELGKSEIDVENTEILRACLARHGAFDAEPDDAWSCGENDRLLATITLEGSRLIMESLSRERLRRARELLREAAAEAGLTHRSTHYTDPAEALHRHPREMPDDPGSELPPEEMQAIVSQFKTDHYRRWIDEAAPALDNLTPRQAVGQKEMRPRLIDLLKGIENGEARERRHGRPAIETDWLWDELGVAAGEIVIARMGKPVAPLTPVPEPKRRFLGADEGKFEVPDDFNAPLPDDDVESPKS